MKRSIVDYCEQNAVKAVPVVVVQHYCVCVYVCIVGNMARPLQTTYESKFSGNFCSTLKLHNDSKKQKTCTDRGITPNAELLTIFFSNYIFQVASPTLNTCY